MDTITLAYVSIDTVYESNNYTLITEHMSPDCSTVQTDSFQVVTTSVNLTFGNDTIYTLEGNLCDSIVIDSIIIVDIQDSTVLFSVDTLLVNSIIDTVTTTTLLNIETVFDTTLSWSIYDDSIFIVDQSQYESGDTLFTVTDSLLAYQISDLYVIQSFQSKYYEITGCGMTVLDTTFLNLTLQNLLLINVDTVFISQTISFDIIEPSCFLDNLKVYPNPTSSWCIVEIPRQIKQQSFQIEITTSDGRSMLKKSYTDGAIDPVLEFSDFAAGTYSINLISADGSFFQHFIVVVQ